MYWGTTCIGWKRHWEEWIKFNCDEDSLGLVGCGGFFRNPEGRVDRSKDTHGKLEHIALSLLKCGECIW
jgi:hypothetical protein